MSHYYCLAVLPPGATDINDTIEQLLAPHEERYDEANDESTGWWDWYQIGVCSQ